MSLFFLFLSHEFDTSFLDWTCIEINILFHRHCLFYDQEYCSSLVSKVAFPTLLISGLRYSPASRLPNGFTFVPGLVMNYTERSSLYL